MARDPDDRQRRDLEAAGLEWRRLRVGRSKAWELVRLSTDHRLALTWLLSDGSTRWGWRVEAGHGRPAAEGEAGTTTSARRAATEVVLRRLGVGDSGATAPDRLRDLEVWGGRLGWRWHDREVEGDRVLLDDLELLLGEVDEGAPPADAPWGWAFAGGVPAGNRRTQNEAMLALLSRRLVAWLGSLEGWGARYGAGSLDVRGPGGLEASAVAGGSNLWSVAGGGNQLAGLEPDEAVAEVALRGLRAADEAGAVPGVLPVGDSELDLELLERCRQAVEGLG